jgi:hypothetical protein
MKKSQLKQQEIQLKTPCRVIIENLRHTTDSSKENDAAEMSSLATVKITSVQTERKRKGRPRKVRNAFSDSEEPTPKKKLSGEDLRKILTPLQVKVSLDKLNSEELQIDDAQKDGETDVTTPKRTSRKSLPAQHNSSFFDSGSEDNSHSDEEWMGAKATFTPVKVDSSKITKRYRSRSKINISSKKSSPKPKAPVLKIKFLGNKNLQPSKKHAVSSSELDSESDNEMQPESPTKSHSKKTMSATKSEKETETEKPARNRIRGRPPRDVGLKSAAGATETKAGPKSLRGRLALKNMSKFHKSKEDSMKPSEERKEADDTKDSKAEDVDTTNLDMELDSGALNVTYTITSEIKAPEKVVKPEKPVYSKPCPKSKKACDTQKSVSPVNAEPHIDKDQSEAPVDANVKSQEPAPKPKKPRPMPLSKKIKLGLIPIDEDIEIVHENISAHSPAKVKQEIPSPPNPDNNQTHDYMRSFLKRLSEEDPLEGTSRQNVYKKPQPPPPKDTQKKKSLRHMDKKSYEESPLSDCHQTDDDTWYPQRNHPKKK